MAVEDNALSVMALSRTQIRRLGERLAASEFPDDADLDLLAEYEHSFEPALDFVVGELTNRFNVRATRRPQKSVASIVGKLRREHTRLQTMQDIAGCRVIVETILDQNQLVERLAEHDWEARVDDRRIRPSYGYRAVHLIVTVGDRRVEVQVRTVLQDRWAQISEKAADRFGIEVKYGGGPGDLRAALEGVSAASQRLEVIEATTLEEPSPEQRVELEVELDAVMEAFRIHSDRLMGIFGQ